MLWVLSCLSVKQSIGKSPFGETEMYIQNKDDVYQFIGKRNICNRVWCALQYTQWLLKLKCCYTFYNSLPVCFPALSLILYCYFYLFLYNLILSPTVPLSFFRVNFKGTLDKNESKFLHSRFTIKIYFLYFCRGYSEAFQMKSC